MEFVTGFPPEPAQVVYSFNNYPFFAGNHSLELSYSYITDLVLNAVPYIGVGTGLSVICLIILIVRFTCFRKKSDKAESSQVEMEANILLRLISTLSIAIIACGAAFGFLGTHVLVKSLGHDENALDGSIHWMTASANFFQQTFSSQGLQAQLNTSYPAYSDILQAMQEIEQEATDFKSTMDNVLNSIENTFVTVKKYSSYSFYGAYGLIGLVTAVALLLIYLLGYRPLYVKIPSLIVGILFMWLCWIILSLVLMLLWGSSNACHIVYVYFKTKSLDGLPSALKNLIPAENNLPSIELNGVGSILQQAVVSSFQSQVTPVLTVLNETLNVYESCKKTIHCELANLPLADVYMHTCSSDEKHQALRGSASAVQGGVLVLIAMVCFCIGFLLLIALGISYVNPQLGHRTVPVKLIEKEYSHNVVDSSLAWLDMDTTRPIIGGLRGYPT